MYDPICQRTSVVMVKGKYDHKPSPSILSTLEHIKPLVKAANYREWRLTVIDILAEKGYWEIVSGKLDGMSR